MVIIVDIVVIYSYALNNHRKTIVQEFVSLNLKLRQFLRWTTPVHETRFEAERCIEQAKTDIAILERQLVKLGWTRDMLNEKERKRNERRKRTVRSSNEDTIKETVERVEPKVVIEKQVNNYKNHQFDKIWDDEHMNVWSIKMFD